MFTEQEKQIIERGKELGKTSLEIQSAVAKYRQETGYVAPQPPQETTVGSRVSNVIQNQGEKVYNAISGEGEFAGQSSLRRGVQATAEAFKAAPMAAMAAAPEPVQGALGAVAKPFQIGFKKLTDMIGSIPALQKWVSENPDAARVVEEAAGTLKGGGEIAGTILLADQTAKAGQYAVDKTTEGISTLRSKTQPLIDRSTELVKRGLKPQKDVQGAMGEVLQGTKKDIKKSLDSFKVIDANKIKTYADLKNQVDDNIAYMSEHVDGVLSTDSTKTLLDDLVTSTKTGSGTAVSTNYVEKALTHLKELYDKTDDLAARAEIDDLINTAKTEGLSKLEINDIARLYNTEFGSKAFSKMGDPLTSVNAQAYENVRKGVKDIARKGMGEATEFDDVISSLYNTKRLVDKRAQAVQALQQKIQQRGLIEKLAYNTVKTIDLLSGGSLRGIMEGILPRGVGYKVMNALDLEERLRKNLEIIEKAVNAVDDAATVSAIKELEKTMSQASVGQSVSSSKRTTDMFGNNKQGGYIKNPFVREDLKRTPASNPRDRNLHKQAKAALAKAPNGNPAARELLRAFIAGKDKAVTRTEIATAIDLLLNK